MKNKENIKLFHQPAEADNWIWRIENGVGDWVKQKNDKSFWYIVLWESKRQGILKEETTREKFCRLLVQECEKALSDGDTETKIFHNIEKFKYKRDLKNFDKIPEMSLVREYVYEVSALLTKDIPSQTATAEFTLEQRMEEYLTSTTASENFTKVCIRPIYNGKTATMSLENYVSQRFMDEHRPSRTVIFECVNETVTEEKVETIYGRFCKLSNTKLFIASTHAFSGNVKKEAGDRDIGLVLVNPQYKVNEYCFVLPRVRGDQPSEEMLWLRMLEGKEKMTVPILVYDNDRIDDSLSFILYKHALCEKKNLFVAAPVLSDSEIEAEALRLIKPQVDKYVLQLRQCGPDDKVPLCVIDPYSLAEEMGLTVNRGKTGRHLGQIDFDNKEVTLSDRQEYDDPSDRFSMAHEIGHHIFHHPISEILKDGHHHIVTYAKKWLEHHAHYFASCLLMPAPVIRMLYSIYWKKEFKSEKVSAIYVDNDYYYDPVFQRVIGPVARKMRVSKQAAYIRLHKMGLICDKSIKLVCNC